MLVPLAVHHGQNYSILFGSAMVSICQLKNKSGLSYE